MTTELVTSLQMIVQQDPSMYDAFHAMKDHIKERVDPNSLLNIVKFLQWQTFEEKMDYLQKGL